MTYFRVEVADDGGGVEEKLARIISVSYTAAKKMRQIGGGLGDDVRESSRPCCVVLELVVLFDYNAAKKMRQIGGGLGDDVRESSRPCCVVLERVICT